MSWLVPADGWYVGGAYMYIVYISIWITKKRRNVSRRTTYFPSRLGLWSGREDSRANRLTIL